MPDYSVIELEQMAEDIVEQTVTAAKRLEYATLELQKQEERVVEMDRFIAGFSDLISETRKASTKLAKAGDRLLKKESDSVLSRVESSMKKIEAISEESSNQASELLLRVGNLEKVAEQISYIALQVDKIKGLPESILKISDRLDGLEGSVEEILAILGPESSLMSQIDRVDKNTQKGFGKIKG